MCRMLRGSCGSIRQGTRRASTGPGGPPPLLRVALHVQCSHDDVLPAQSAAVAVATGNRIQQRRQHNFNGPAGQVAVRRGNRNSVASGRCLHSLGSCAGHSRGTAAAAAAATAAAAGTAIAVVRVEEGGLLGRGGLAASAASAAAAVRCTAGGLAHVGGSVAESCRRSRCSLPRHGPRAGGVLAPRPGRNARGTAKETAANAAAGGATTPPAPEPPTPTSTSTPPTPTPAAPGTTVAEAVTESSGRENGIGSDRGAGADGVRCSLNCRGGSSGDGYGDAAGPPSEHLGVTHRNVATSASQSKNDTLTSPSSPLPPSSSDEAAAGEGLITSTTPSFVQDRSGGLGRLGKFSHRLIVAYDGTDYCGWQLQPSAPTVQRFLESALCTVLREDRAVLGVRAAGRTDSGVHARGQVVQFSCNRELDLDKMSYKLNSVLPHDIRVLRITRTAPDFSVTCSALGKCYHYSLTNAEAHDPLRHRYAMHVRKPLDLVAMRAAAVALEGTRDFTQFSNIGEEGGRPRKRNPVKTLKRVEVVELGEGVSGAMRIEVEQSGAP
ncbi:hypothetical protein Vafri_16701 [Volvox africanus]|uniref:Pseudouridine synthase I TruA alpha/beta domain-containing protein n=1 Tax=Volvox africanus TaxID=51714 RepID=A0A8J4BIU6_9CHLO|nr:hypothetical protein Vafri_16701 [Volvox africanus]